MVPPTKAERDEIEQMLRAKLPVIVVGSVPSAHASFVALHYVDLLRDLVGDGRTYGLLLAVRQPGLSVPAAERLGVEKSDYPRVLDVTRYLIEQYLAAYWRAKGWTT